MNQENKDNEIRVHALLGFAYWQRSSKGSRIIRFYWGKILLLLLFLTAGAWITGSSALYYFFKYAREYEEVRFFEMFTLPFHLDEHRIKIGTYHIEKGIQLLEEEEGNPAEGFRLLQLGLARNPSHLDARKKYATIFASIVPDRALTILTEGLQKYGGLEDKEYLGLTIELMKYLHREQELLELSKKLIEENGIGELNRKRLIGELIRVQILHGDFDQANQSIQRYNIEQTVEGLVFLAEIEKSKGEANSQIYYLKQALNVDKDGENFAQIIHEICNAYLKLGKIDDALQFAGLLSHHLVFAKIHHHNGDREAEDAQIKRMIETQSQKPEARLQLAAYAAETGNIELATEIYELAAIHNDELQDFASLLIHAKLQANNFKDAQTDIEAIFAQNPDWLERQKPYLQKLRAISSYGLYRPDLGDIYLEEFSSAYAMQPAMLLDAAKELRRIGVSEKAHQLLSIGLHSSENHPELLAQMIDLSIENNSYDQLEEYLRRFLNLRRPDIDFAKRILSAIRLNPNLFAEKAERNELIHDLRSIIQN